MKEGLKKISFKSKAIYRLSAFLRSRLILVIIFVQKTRMNRTALHSKTQKSNLNRGLKEKEISIAPTKETPLCKLAYKYGTDKCPRIKHNFTPYYYSIFKSMRKSVKLFFEMGIGFYQDMQKVDKTYDPNLKRWYHKGASLKMWRDFFPNAQVVGADLRHQTLFKDERIDTYLCDERDPKQVNNLLKKIGEKIDIFIDDGSHNKDLQVLLAKTALPLLKRDVIYIIEDVTHTDYVRSSLKKYDCEVIECSKRWRDDHLLIIKNS